MSDKEFVADLNNQVALYIYDTIAIDNRDIYGSDFYQARQIYNIIEKQIAFEEYSTLLGIGEETINIDGMAFVFSYYSKEDQLEGDFYIIIPWERNYATVFFTKNKSGTDSIEDNKAVIEFLETTYQ